MANAGGSAAGQQARRELLREGAVVVGSGVLLTTALLTSNGLFDGLQPLLEYLPDIADKAGDVVPDAVSSVAGNWLSNPTYRRFSELCARLTGEPERDTVLWAAVGRAYTSALVEIKADIERTADTQRWSKANRKAISEAIQFFQADVAWLRERLPDDPGTVAGATVQATAYADLLAHVADPANARLYRAWEQRLGRYLIGLDGTEWHHQRYLLTTIGQQLPPRLTACFVREIQTHQETFQTFSYLLQTSSQRTLAEVRAGQLESIAGQAALNARLDELAAKLDGWHFQDPEATRLLGAIQTFLQHEIVAVLARLDQQLAALTDLTTALRADVGQLHDDMIEQTGAILGDTAALLAGNTAILGKLDQLAPPPPSRLTSAALRTRHPLFGRDDEIAQTVAALEQGETVLVHGSPGMGKTALATEVAYRLREARADALPIVWLHDLGTIDLPGLCDALGAALGEPGIRELSPADKVFSARTLLAAQPLLLVLDNLVDPDTAEAFAAQVRPVGLATLLTSQEQAVGRIANRQVRLRALTPQLTPGAAEQLFRNRARLGVGPDPAIEAIADLLGYHPLALVVVAGQVAEEGEEPRALVPLLRRAEERLRLTLGAGRDRGVSAALQVAWDALPADARHLLARLAACPATSTGLPFLALVAGVDEAACRRTLGLLARRSLVERGDGRASLHGLVRDFGQGYPEAAPDEAAAALLTAARAYAMEHGGNTPADYDALEAEVENLGGAVELAAHRADWATLQSLTDSLISDSAALRTRGYWHLAIQIGRAGMDAAARQGDDAAAARLAHNTAIMIQDQGDYPEARRLYADSLAIKERLGDQGGVATTLHQLGNLAYQQGDYLEARRLYADSLAIKERLGDQRGVASTLHQLGMLAYQQGDYPEARRLYAEVRATFEQLGDQLGTATSLLAIGVLALDDGDVNGARPLLTEALAIYQRLEAPQAAALQQLLAQLPPES